MSPARTPTTAQRENRCAIAVCNAAVEVTPIARQQRSAKGVRRKSSVPRLPIASSSCTGTNRPGRVVRALAGTAAYVCSQRARRKIEALFSELKQRLGLRRVRLRRLWNVAEQFFLAATAQNLKRLVRFLAQRQPSPALSTA